MSFKLDARLAADTIEVTEWPLCKVLLMNDANYPWLILVPVLSNIRELYELSTEQRQQFNKESDHLGQSLMDLFSGTKLNVAALGNVVSQLHIHHVVRFKTDVAWPSPVWGARPPKPYANEALEVCLARLGPLKNASFC
jgi:diadenosine tetraphosphate (Ap4A) HIT family hydrolase